jgi:hypothetical protein
MSAIKPDELRGPHGRRTVTTTYDMVVSGGDLYDALAGEPTGTRVLVVLPDGRELQVASGEVADTVVTLPGGEQVAGDGRTMRLIAQGPLIRVLTVWRHRATGEINAVRVDVNGVTFDAADHSGHWAIGWMADWGDMDRLQADRLVTAHTVGADRTPYSHSEYRLVPALRARVLAAASELES